MGPGFESLRTHQKATAVLLFFYVVRDFATMLHHALRGEPRHTRLTLVFFCKTTCMTRYYGSLWASYESLRTHQKATAGLLFFYMRTKASRHIAPKSNSRAVVFLCRQGLCNYVAPRIAWRTPAHQADARLFLQDNLHDSLLRKPLGFLRVPEDAPSVMVYKSFLIDHHFCIFRGIFTPF